MATKADVFEILTYLAAAYPKEKPTPPTIEVYCELLKDLDAKLLKQAAIQHMGASKFFPTIAELRELCAGMMERLTDTPSAAEAWGEVREAVVHYGYTLRRSQFSHPIIDKLVDIFGWETLCRQDDEIANRAHFLRAYEDELKRIRDEVRLLPSVREKLAELQAAGFDVTKELKALQERNA